MYIPIIDVNTKTVYAWTEEKTGRSIDLPESMWKPQAEWLEQELEELFYPKVPDESIYNEQPRY